MSNQVFLAHQRALQQRQGQPRGIPGPVAQHGQADLPQQDGGGRARVHQDDDIRVGGAPPTQRDVTARQGLNSIAS